MSKSKEEILNGHIMSNNLLSVSNAFNKGAKRTDVYNIAISAMEQYATQQTAALEKEVERLRTGLKEIMQTVQKYNSFSGETGCGNHCYNIANEILIG